MVWDPEYQNWNSYMWHSLQGHHFTLSLGIPYPYRRCNLSRRVYKTGLESSWRAVASEGLLDIGLPRRQINSRLATLSCRLILHYWVCKYSCIRLDLNCTVKIYIFNHKMIFNSVLHQIVKKMSPSETYFWQKCGFRQVKTYVLILHITKYIFKVI